MAQPIMVFLAFKVIESTIVKFKLQFDLKNFSAIIEVHIFSGKIKQQKCVLKIEWVKNLSSKTPSSKKLN